VILVAAAIEANLLNAGSQRSLGNGAAHGFGSRRYFERDVIVPPVEVAADGTVAVPTSAGLGFDVDVAFLESRTESVERLRPSTPRGRQ
jgi:L-alanine-DL-glutamate epimerase-like enolase superfamily enzyme